jgi:hypothetical protein
MRKWFLIPFPFHLISMVEAGCATTSLGYKIDIYLSYRKKSIIIMCEVLCRWLHEVGISSFDFSLMLKDFHAIVYTSFMRDGENEFWWSW